MMTSSQVLDVEIKLRTLLQLDPGKLQEAVTFAYRVAELNRNEIHGHLVIITDASEIISDWSARADVTAGCDVNERLGSTFYDQRTMAIWLTPRFKNEPFKALILTLVHELAHAMTAPRCNHNWTWRRMFTLLLVKIGQIFNVYFDPAHEVDKIIYRYASTRVSYRGYDKYDTERVWSNATYKHIRHNDEYHKHMAAALRMEKRLAKSK